MSEKSELLNQLKIDRNAEPAPSSFSITAVIAIAVISLGIGGGGMYFLGGATEPNAPTPTPKVEKQASLPVSEPTQVKTTVPAPKPVEPASEKILNASGYITARRMATVSAEIMGLITDVRVEEGMTVERGQILATLDDAVANANLQFAKAQVRASEARIGSIKANLAEAERVLDRARQLNEADFSSEASVTRAQADVESLRANLQSAQADVDVARSEQQRQQERYDDHTIKAPFGGVVTVKNAQPGEIVAPSSAGGGFTRTGICTIVDMGSLEIEVDVNEAFIGRVFEGQRVEANLDAYPDWNIPASVIAIIPTADRAKATVRVRISIDVKDSRILPDMGVKVAFMKA